LERYLDWPFADLIIVPAMDGASRSYKLVQDFIGRGANNMLEVQTFQYIIQNEAGETIGGYTSTEEPPLKGDVITLHDIPDWESAEVLGVTMLLAKHYNEIVVKVRSADRYPL